ncbi:MAG: hypothetical protein V1702_05905 [Candidatus Woesearchaeota archaeon]
MYRIAPLPGTFMLMSMFGFIISTVYTVSGRLDLSFGFAFSFVFAIMFISAVLSITPWFPEELAKGKRK